MKKLQNSDIKEGELYLSRKQMKDKGLEQVCNLDTLAIEQMDLSLNRLSSLGIKIMSAGKWGNLKGLDLTLNKIGDKGCKYLSRISFDNLTKISFGSNKIGNTGAIHISKAQWRKVKAVNIGYNPLNIGSTRHIARVNWGDLSKLDLRFCKLKLSDLLYLAMLPSKLQFLSLIDIWALRAEMKATRCINEKMPRCSIEIQYQSEQQQELYF